MFGAMQKLNTMNYKQLLQDSNVPFLIYVVHPIQGQVLELFPFPNNKEKGMS